MRVGIVGGGQLGRMLALAAYPLGLKVRVLDPQPDCCAGQVAEQIVGDYDDPAALARLAAEVDAVTYEFENVPAAAAKWLTEHVTVFPPPEALAIAQDRLDEKTTFRALGVETPAFAAVNTRAELDAAVTALKLPAVLKTRRLGYDGKGQVVIRQADQVAAAWAELAGAAPPEGAGLILEAFVPFRRELAIIGVRGRDGATAFYPLVETRQRDGMLATAVAPAPGRTRALQLRAEDACARLLARLNYVGVLALELFEHEDGRLLANEFAPRVHNSGHWTIEGAETSQFANHLRAVLGLPLGAAEAVGCSALLNLVGEVPPIAKLAAVPHACIHLYGKAPRAGRKVGHVTVRAADEATAGRRLAEVEAALG